MSKQLQGVCFDFDGVLMDSPIVGFERVCEVFETFEIRVPTWKEFFTDYREVLKRYFRECEDCEPTARELHDWFKYYSFDIEVSFFPEVSHVIRTLYDRRVPMWVVSSNATEVIESLLFSENIHHLFDEVRGDEFEKSVPLRAFCKKHCLDPRRVGFVEDFPVGIQAGKQAGTYTIGRRTRTETDHMLVEAGADACIDTLHDLLELVPTQEEKTLQFEITVGTYPKRGNGSTGKKFTIQEYNEDGTVVKTTEDRASTFRQARKKMGSIIPGDILATTKIRNHGTTHIYR